MREDAAARRSSRIVEIAPHRGRGALGVESEPRHARVDLDVDGERRAAGAGDARHVAREAPSLHSAIATRAACVRAELGRFDGAEHEDRAWSRRPRESSALRRHGTCRTRRRRLRARARRRRVHGRMRSTSRRPRSAPAARSPRCARRYGESRRDRPSVRRRSRVPNAGSSRRDTTYATGMPKKATCATNPLKSVKMSGRW